MPKQEKPKCDPSKSTPCGFACIPKKNNCLDELDEASIAIARKLIDTITGESRTAGAVIGKEELSVLKDNAEFLASATPEQIRKRAEDRGLAELKADGVEFSEALVDAVWQALPSASRGKIKLKGGVTEVNAFDPDSGEFKAPTESRGKNILRQYIVQNGRDAYTGLPLGGLRTADLEHIKPMEEIGRDADRPENLVLTSAAVNQWKSAKSLDKWLADDVAKRTNEDIDKSLAKQAAKKSKKNAVEEALGEADVNAIDDAYIDALGNNYHTLGKLTGVSMSFRYTRPATGKVGSKKIDADLGVPLQKASIKAMQAKDVAKLTEIKAVRDEAAKLAKSLAQNEISANEYKSRVKDVILQLSFDN